MTMSLINVFKIGDIRIDEYFKSTPQATNLDDPKSIDGYSVVECDLKKELLKPSEFAFTLRHNTPLGNSFDVIDKLVGKSVYCNVMTMEKEGTLDTQLRFKGIIDKVSMKGLNITCIAYSEDCKLQGPAKCRSFCDMKIADIVNAVVSEYNIKKQVVIQTDVEDLIFPFIVQYNESDYDFLVRLAKRFGAFFYYHDVDSKVFAEECLIFGALPSDTQKNLDSAKAVSYELEAGNSNYRFVAHQGEKDLLLVSPGFEFASATASDKLTKMAIGGSTEYTSPDKKYYIDYPYSLTKTPKQDDIELHNVISLISDADRMVTCKFISYRFDVQVGDIVTVDNNGVLVVTAVHLTWDCNGSPQNEVTAMRLPNSKFNNKNLFAPYVDFNAYPKSSAQRAVVIKNVDSQSMGRVQVRFAWQQDPNEDTSKYPWIRIAQPYGGSKNKDDDKGKGFYILPEVGEEVMVGFEHDNLEKPFIIGTLYHDSDDDKKRQMPAASWVETDQANKNNEVKAFRTKKGHTIEIHDVDGQDKYGFIRIYGNGPKDQPDYDIILSTDPIKDKDYSVKSATVDNDEVTEDYKIEKLRVLVRSNGGDIMLDAGEEGDIIMNAKNIRLHTNGGDRTALIEGKDVVKVNDVRFVKTNESRFYVDADQIVCVKDKDQYSSKELKMNVDEGVDISAKSLSLKTDQKTEIKAQSINTNTKQNTEIVAQTFKASAREEINLFGSNKVTITSNKDVGVLGMSKATLQGAETNVTGMSKINLKAPSGTRVGSWTDM